ncbi:hypothetical protein [Marinobacter lutaoensis]|jgi:hypothetical protein|uniref:hypothetical protein n=1 Tax=Marinobacter lutaoensis TaxID=135739 RepID=UPI0020CF88D8|nr:hypothetical protein [Marinobacter lutaoensis]
MDTYFPHQLGQLMCEATLRILWPPAADWLGRRAAGSALHCRVGTGKATYHRYDPQRRHHLITYGMRMVAAKQEAGTADGWLSTREILARGYFDGELSTLNLLAHTCCHEFAHLLQCSAGQRARGSVHNREFYTILDELHASGGAEATRRFLADEADRRGLPLSDRPFLLPEPRQLARQWRIGQAVTFGEGRHQGRVVRINRKTCTVEGTGPSRGSRFRVPLSLLRPA